MKRDLLLFLTLIFTCTLLNGQLSFTDKRVRDRTLNEGIAHIQQDQYSEAADCFNRCLELDSTLSSAYLFRGRIFMEWGIMEDAMSDIDMAIAYDEQSGEALFYKAYLLFGVDTTGMDAILFDRAIELGYEDSWAYYYRGITRIMDGNDGMALNDLNEAIELKIDFALAYHERAGIKRRNADIQGAHFDYSTAIEYQPVFPLAYSNRGSAKILLGDYEGAITDYSTAIEQDVELVLAYNNRGYARYFMGDYDAALEDFDTAILLNDSTLNARLNKASLLAGQNETAPALSLLDQVLEEHPNDALLYLNRGFIRELTGDLDGACNDWAAAWDLGSKEAEEHLKECKNL